MDNAERIDDVDWKTKFTDLELERNKQRDEFNTQRAKMKELFMQKEAECKKLAKEMEVVETELNEVKSQILVAEFNRDAQIQQQDRKAQEEIASLQQLVHETIEESSNSKSEIDRLLDELEKLREDNAHLRAELSHSQQQDSNSLAPVISHVRKTIARKLTGDSGGNDYLEDSMRKAQEDAEVLRSLVVPLEEEIKALKEKLRTTDDELQTFRTVPLTPSNAESALVGMINEQKPLSIATTTTTAAEATAAHPLQQVSPPTRDDGGDEMVRTCVTCDTNKQQLEQTQNEVAQQKQQSALLRKDVDRFKEELEREAVLRRDLEEQWQDKREAHKREVQSLSDRIVVAEREFSALQLYYADAKETIDADLLKLTADREQLHRHLEMLQSDNDFLAGKYLANSEDLQNARIDLPDNLEDLQEELLKIHEMLIEARVGCEFEQRKATSYYDEAQLLRDQLSVQYNDRHEYERQTSARVKNLETMVKQFENEREKFLILKETADKKEIDLEKEISELRVQMIEMRDTSDKAEKQNSSLRQKLSVLQTELGTNETVQKDFVRLSQSLQMELEKIRAADTSVRWQDDEDVDQCPSCKSQFAVTRRKQHCRHCGTIYCEKCLTKSVQSGRAKKPARVCDVCHTLLERNTAPYFSQAPPRSPT